MCIRKSLNCLTVTCLAIFGAGCGSNGEDGVEVLKINGSTTVNLPVAAAAEILRVEQAMQIQVDTQGGSAGGISSLGDGLVHIGMASKSLSDSDRSRYPETDFHPVKIGEDAVALVVSSDVWGGGVKSLSQAEVQSIYEGRVTNWSKVGGPDQSIIFFNKEPGRGTWEVFAKWLYGNANDAPVVSLPEVGGNEEGRNKVSSTCGAISQLSASWADGERVFGLAIELENGELVQPTFENIANGSYPMSRPLFLLTNGEPQRAARVFIDFILSDRGQMLVREHGYLSLDQLN